MEVFPSSRDILRDEAFNTLFNTHWNDVYHLCTNYCRDKDVAKDLTQTIFLSIWERNIELPDPHDASAYLFKAAKFQVLNYIRNQKNTIDVHDRVIENTLIDANRYNPEMLLISTETGESISVKIEELGEPTRSIFLMSREERLTYVQIAGKMDIAVKTVEKHMTRALRQLRGQLLDL